MSLLLQALQKAAKSREAAQPEPTKGIATASGSTLELEPGEIEPAAPRAREFDTLPEPASGPAAAAPASRDDAFEPSPQQAASVLGAAARESGFNLVDFARDRPVPVFAALAFLFLTGYSVYVYIVVSNPGLLTGGARNETRNPRPMVANPPPPAQQAGAPVPDLLEPAPPGGALPMPKAGSGPATATAAAAPAGVPAAGAPPGSATSSAPGTQAAPAAVPAPPATKAPAVALTRTEDIATAPRPVTPRAAAPKRSAAPARPVEAAADAPPAPRRVGEVPVVPAEDRVTVRTVELPGGLNARIAEAWDNAQKGKLAEAEAGYESVLSVDRHNVDAMLGLASLAWQQGRTERAGELYGRILEIDPQNSAAQSGLIGLLGRADPVASESRLRNLIAREPSGQLYFTLGNLYASQSQWAQAQQAYFQAFQSEPGNPDYAFNLAVGLDRLGQRKPALDYYRKAVDLSFARGRAGFDQKAAIARIAQLASAVE
jgi:Tfp pilus assembly protein PilF